MVRVAPARRLGSLGLILCIQFVTPSCASRITTGAVPVPERVVMVPPPSESPSPSDCSLIDEPGEPVAKVGLPERINPANAPYPTNSSEHLLFRQLYETLVRIDCHGQALPGLAASWRLDSNGRAWIVTLRDNARFSDGTPVTPADVITSWNQGPAGNALRPDAANLIESAVALDDRVLAITLRSPQTDAPLALAHPVLAVANRSGARWPLGTRSSRIGEELRSTAAASFVVVERDGQPPIRFVVAPADSRDLLDDDVDLLITRDRATLEYAATLPRFQIEPLPWRQIYVVLTPGRTTASPALSAEGRHALAADAVRGEARGAEGPFWWQSVPECNIESAPPRNSASRAVRVVYEAEDAVGRELAERLVGLSGRPDSASTASVDTLLASRSRRVNLRATGLSDEAFARAQRLGNDAAYVVSLDKHPVDPCGELRSLNGRTQWINLETIEPLIDTRRQAIVYRGRSGVTVDWDGGLLLEPTRNQP